MGREITGRCTGHVGDGLRGEAGLEREEVSLRSEDVGGGVCVEEVGLVRVRGWG